MTDKNIAIRVYNPGKRYTVGESPAYYHTLRDAIVNSVNALFKQFHHAPLSDEFVIVRRMSRLMWNRVRL